MSYSNAIGIIFPNIYDELVPELVQERLMASIPFASRYRLIDFLLSSMVNSGIENVVIVPRKRYHSLLDHLGSGREWDLVRKNGGLTIFPPFAENISQDHMGRIPTLAGILRMLSEKKEKYIIMADTNIAATFDFSAMIAEHEAKGADITVAYINEKIPEDCISIDNRKGYHYTYDIAENGRITGIRLNPTTQDVQNYSMNYYLINRELLVNLLHDAINAGGVFFERDIMLPHLNDLNIYGYEFKGYAARITSLTSYANENLKLLEQGNMAALLNGMNVNTKVHDNTPTIYKKGSKAENVMIAGGCIIEGEVSNCVLFRGVKIEKGAKVSNSILLQDTVVKAGAVIDHIITDKDVTISEGASLAGTESFPVYVGKGKTV